MRESLLLLPGIRNKRSWVRKTVSVSVRIDDFQPDTLPNTTITLVLHVTVCLLDELWISRLFPNSAGTLLLQIIECLKENKKQLSTRCHQKVFKLQETEMMDPELDYTLMRVCKQMIKVKDQGRPKWQ
jgi:hypothetical protein